MGVLDQVNIKQENQTLGNSQLPNVPSLGKEVAQEIKVAEKKYTHFGVPVTLGSRVIGIQQVPKFSLLPKQPEAQHIRDEQVMKIGSTWKKGTRSVIRGLNSQEEIYYLQRIVGISPQSDEWNDKVLNYWLDFTISVPAGKSIDIETGFKVVTVNREEVVEPIDLDGYIKYNFCKEHGRVALTDREKDNPILYDFYLVDKAKERFNEEQRFESMKKINRFYDQLVASSDESSRNKITWILETAGGDGDEVGMNTMPLSPLQREMELEKFKNKYPKKFLELLGDDMLEIKALIRRAVEMSVLSQEGNAIFLDSNCIGSTLLEACAYLKNPTHQNDKLIISSRLKTIAE